MTEFKEDRNCVCAVYTEIDKACGVFHGLVCVMFIRNNAWKDALDQINVVAHDDRRAGTQHGWSGLRTSSSVLYNKDNVCMDTPVSIPQ
jgi:hypothetical protein